MESVSKDDDLALSMSDCFTGEEALLGLFLWFLPTANKKLPQNHCPPFDTEFLRKYLLQFTVFQDFSG